MPDIWVTPLSCSECRRSHDEDDDYGDSCDCWCHVPADNFGDDYGDREG